MADNKDSYTYKRYIKNRNIFSFIKWLLLVYVLWSIYFVSTSIKNGSFNSIQILVLSLALLVVFKVVNKWLYQNKRDMKWNYNTWGRGAGAELSILNALEKLPGYKVIPDFNTGRGNIDCIAIGPKGIFAIEIKSNNGFVSYVNNELLINGKLPEKNYITQTVAEKLKLSDILKRQFGKEYSVTGLLEFPYGRIDKNSIRGKLLDHNIWIGQQSFHKYLIENSRDYLSQEEIEKIYSFLDSSKSINVN